MKRARAGLLSAVVLGGLLTATGGYSQLSSQGAPDPADRGLDLPANVNLLAPSDPSVRKATALINGEVITDTDIDQRLALVLVANGGATISTEERERLRLQILRNLIDEKLQIQEARSQDIVISEAEVDQAFARVASNFKRSEQDFATYLKAAGSSPLSMKQQIRAELAWGRLLRRKVEPFVAVGDDEVNGIIAKLNASKGTQEYRVGEIFLSATPETRGAVQASAANIVQQLRGGASFVAYARQFSEDSTAAIGGDLGWVRAEQLPEGLGKAVQQLQRGQVSEPVDVPGGVAVAALIDTRQILAADPRDAILSLKQMTISFPAGTSQTAANPRVTALNQATRTMGGCGNVEKVAQTVGAEVVQSDQTKLRDLPDALQDILGKLSIGEATPPFGSVEEGVRVLVLCGRDDPDAGGAPSFDQVYQQLNEQRVAMRANRYLRDLRRDAVVDYR